MQATIDTYNLLTHNYITIIICYRYCRHQRHYNHLHYHHICLQSQSSILLHRPVSLNLIL
jgi:hypothetical protein